MVKKTAAIKKQERSFVPALILAFLTAVGLTLVQFALVSSVMCRVDVAPSMLGPLSTVMVCISALASGMALAFCIGSKGMLLGFAGGAVLYLILMAAAFLREDFELSSMAFIKLIAMCAAGAVGGYLGVSLAERRWRKH